MTLAVSFVEFLAAGAVAVPLLAFPSSVANSSALPGVTAPVAVVGVDGPLDDGSDDDRDRDRDAQDRRDEQRQQQLERRQERCEEYQVPPPPMCMLPPSESVG
jgi:hypothetical protein